MALLLLLGVVALGCGPDSAQSYELHVDNRAAEGALIVPTSDDVHEVAPGDAFYLVAPGAVSWVRGGAVYARPAAVFVFDSACVLRGRVTIPANSPGTYLLVIGPDWSLTLKPAPDEETTSPSLAPDNSVPCAAAVRSVAGA